MEYLEKEWLILHRYLSPDSLFLDGHDNIKVGDFDYGEILYHGQSFSESKDGIIPFMSPERIQGQ